MQNKFWRQAVFYVLIFMILMAIAQQFLSVPVQEVRELNFYPDFINLLEEDKIATIEQIEQDVTGQLKDGTRYITIIPPGENLSARVEGKDVKYIPKTPPEPSLWMNLLTYILPFLLILGIFVFFMHQTQGSGNKMMNFSRSRARLHEGGKRKVMFSDVAGADEEKQEMEEIVEFLKEPTKFQKLGARIPKGVLLVGPPGTGKTLLARAVAGEAGVPFFSISGSDFVEMFVGVGASRVRDMFENAKKNSPCIVFIDEIDAVGRQRGAGLGGGHDEREQTLNALLVEMDGFDVNEGIIVMAATNRPDVLDPALLRPGRFDRQITVNYPDVNGREAILKVHARNKPLAPDTDLKIVARRTPGFSGADLENILNEGALLAARRNKHKIEMDELEEAIDRVIAGTEKKSRVISEFEKRLVSFHEAGHALVGYLLPHTDPVHKVTIIPRGRAGGFTLMLPEEDRYLMTKNELLDRVGVLLGGRVAEQVVLNEVSTGAQNDLERATHIVRQMIMEYGMSDQLGPITLGRKQEQVFLGRDLVRERDFSEEIASTIDQEIRRMMDTCYRKARDIITNNRDKLDRIANALLEKETLDAEDIALLMEGKPLPEAKDQQGRELQQKEDKVSPRLVISAENQDPENE